MVSSKSDSSRPQDASSVEGDYVQTLIAEINQAFATQSLGITVGSFVRVQDGECKDYRGHVTFLDGETAAVQIDLKTKVILLKCPLRNLVNLEHVPADLRVFYYCSLVKAMADDIGPSLIAQDLHYEEDPFEPEDEPSPAPVKEKRTSWWKLHDPALIEKRKQ